MTMESDQDSPRAFRSLSYQAIQYLWRSFGLLARIAVAPFCLSVGAVMMARLVGPPMRYGFDVMHGLFLISYITSVSRVAQSHASGKLVTGWSVFGLAVPRPVWPGLRPLGGMLAEALLLMLPTALILFIAAAFLSAALSMIDSLVLDVVGHILPEFILNTLFGLVIGAGLLKHQGSPSRKL